jgi:hypothetical protein
VAIVQISQITNRKGLASNLPQLAGAELGWSTDTRQLWIGNGTLEDGAPVIGNTEILTEFSDILNFTTTYTYKGQAAGYTVQTGPTPGTPVTQSLQSWLDQYASVKDFGAVGDGTTDDTDAINRALSQIYCQEINPQIRRSLFFPAGVYRVTGSINIPTYATLYGEGSDNSIIAMDNDVADYVARTADSLQQTGVNIGTGGAIPPQYITVTNLGFTHNDPTGSVFLVEDATNCQFQNVGFRGTSTKSDLTSDANASIGVTFSSTPSLVCQQIIFNGCVFSGLVWGVNSTTYNNSPGNLTSQQVKGLTVSNSNFDTLYRGVVLTNTATNPTGPGSTGTRIVGNLFDNIYDEGIIFGLVTLNASAYNMFYDVGNHFTGSAGTPYSSNIDIQSSNNISIGDLFERTDAYAAVYPCVNINETLSIATTNGSQITQGTYTRQTGQKVTLQNNTSGSAFTFSTDVAKAFKIEYTIIRDVTYRTGTIMVATAGGSYPVNSLDTGVDNDTSTGTGITLTVSQTGTDVSLDYTATDTGVNATISYSITYLA